MNGKAVRSTVTNKRKILETYLNYDKTFSDIHKLGAMFGYSWEQNDDNDGFQLTTYDYYRCFCYRCLYCICSSTKPCL